MVDVGAVLTAPPEHASSSVRIETREARVRSMVDAHFNVVWRSLRRLGVASDAVDDAAQQVFVVAARRADVIEAGGERAYLLGIAVRVASETRRARMRRREVTQEDGAREPEAPLPAPDELLDQKRARELLDGILLAMPEDLRDAFVLFEVEGIGIAQIATMLEIPIGTVSSRIRRARELFQKRVNRLVRSADTGAKR
jgi:RNA polymerase sigma-70 factor (ECF subfamily)